MIDQELLNKIRETVRNVFAKHFGDETVVEEIPKDTEVLELILLTNPTCPACDALKRKIAHALQEGWIREVPATTEEGKRIAQELNIMSVPQLIARLTDRRLVKCKYWFEGDDFVFDFDIKKK